jgi:hypothetical protein
MSTFRSPAGPPFPGSTFAARADLVRPHAFGDFDLDSLAADDQIRSGTEDGVAKIDRQLCFEIGAARRPLLETATSAEEVRKMSVNRLPRPSSAGRRSARRHRWCGIESAERAPP